MHHEVDLQRHASGRDEVIRVPISTWRFNINDLMAELRENCKGLCEIGVDKLPPGAENIRGRISEKLERILCYEVLGKMIYYIGIKYVSPSSLRLVGNKNQ